MTEEKDLDDDKPRRNLLIGSALVLLVWWLDIPLEQLIDKLTGLQGGVKSHPGRGWFAVLAVLLYLGHRYTFTGAGMAAVSQFVADWQNYRVSAAVAQAKRHVQRAAAKRIDSALFKSALVPYFDNAASGLSIDRSQGGRIWPDEGLGLSFDSPYEAKVRIPVAGVQADGNRVGSSGSLLACDWRTARQRLPIQALATIGALLRSRSTTSLVVLWLLAGAAAGVAGWKVGPHAAAWVAKLL